MSNKKRTGRGSRLVYLDNNATTQMSKPVFDAMSPFLRKNFGNPSSIHSFGGANRKYVENARKQVAKFLHTKTTKEIIFTAGGSESDNTAIFSAINSFPNKKHIITSKVEHPAVLEVFKHLQSRGYRADYINVDKNGNFDMAEFKSKISKDTALVSIMWANNETGTLFPIEEIAKITKKYGALFHTDAVQIAGKLPINLQKLPNIDMLSLSAHKIHGPKGMGALYIKDDARFMPLLIGGHQEFGNRAGTENVAGIVGFGRACELATKKIKKEKKKVSKLRDKLEKQLTKIIPDTKINGDIKNRTPNTTNISFKYVEGEAILLMMDEFGICASSGSACTSGSLEPSHVLRAMNVGFNYAHGSIRFSLSVNTTEKEIDFVIKKLPKIIKTLRAMSPFKK